MVTGGEGTSITVHYESSVFEMKLSKDGRSEEDISSKIKQGNIVIGELNSVRSSWKIPRNKGDDILCHIRNYSHLWV